MGTALAIISTAVSAIGTGLQYSAQMSAARTQETFSLLNAQAGVQQATQQANQLALQSQLQAAQSDAARRTAEENAAAQRSQAEMESLVGQENLRRSREEFQRRMAATRTQYAAGGADVSTLSPLDFLLSQSEAQSQLESEQQWQIETSRRAAFRQAAGTALGGRVEGLNSTLHLLEADSALAEGRMRAAQARLGGLAGQAQAAGMRSQAFGGLIGGLGNLGMQYYSLTNLQPRAGTVRPPRARVVAE